VPELATPVYTPVRFSVRLEGLIGNSAMGKYYQPCFRSTFWFVRNFLSGLYHRRRTGRSALRAASIEGANHPRSTQRPESIFRSSAL
jgi:hypothetical protein